MESRNHPAESRTRYGLTFGKPPAVAVSAMVATSQPLATVAGLRMMKAGGNAVDAALAAAAVLCVTEPMSTGLGGDLFSIIWRDSRAIGIDAAGPAPASASRETPPAPWGPSSITVPGAVRGWELMSRSHGRLGLDTCLQPAIDIARAGFAVGFRCAELWRAAEGQGRCPEGWRPAPGPAEVRRLPRLAASLEAVAEGGPEALYEGAIADAIVESSWLEHEDLRDFEAAEVTPLSIDYGGYTVFEMPPPSQGVVALEALGLLEHLGTSTEAQIRAVALALDDGYARVRDGAVVDELLDPEFLRGRATETPSYAGEPAGGTVYLCAVDEDRMAVSVVQSLFERFGSGVEAGETGIVLNNRASGFAVGGEVIPGQRPYHTIIPGMLARDGALAGPFGVMGGHLQAQAHLQLLTALIDRGLDPQAALDQPRFYIDRERLKLEPGLEHAARVPAEALGLAIDIESDPHGLSFGAGQAIMVAGDSLVGGTDPRRDGVVLGV
jgi:gamma-glutamyltranspeptidase/glutathione hydrolase